MLDICVCGYGNLAHAIVAGGKYDSEYSLSILSLHEKADETVSIVNVAEPNKLHQAKNLTLVSSNPKHVLADADVIILCLPTHIRGEFFRRFSTYIKPTSILAAFPGTSGFNEEVQHYLPKNKKYFATQRVPFIARIIEKGSKVESYVKPSVSIASSFDQAWAGDFIKNLTGANIDILKHFDSVNLSNSNPLLHSSRLFDFCSDKVKPFWVNNEFFYRDWTDRASEILLEMDAEFMGLVKSLSLSGINSIQAHYEVSDAAELTKKIKSIDAFKNIPFPIKKIGKYKLLDLSSRYFIEDMGFGLNYIKYRADALSFPIPRIKSIANFYSNLSKN